MVFEIAGGGTEKMGKILSPIEVPGKLEPTMFVKFEEELDDFKVVSSCLTFGEELCEGSNVAGGIIEGGGTLKATKGGIAANLGGGTDKLGGGAVILSDGIFSGAAILGGGADKFSKLGTDVVKLGGGADKLGGGADKFGTCEILEDVEVVEIIFGGGANKSATTCTCIKFC